MKTYSLFILLFLLTTMAANAQEFRSAKEDYLKMARYLANGSGKWMAPNPRHDPDNPRSARALGLWFDLSNRENVLRLSIVAYRGDTVHIASDALWIWHPGEQKIKYYDMNRGGIFQEGETFFSADDTFVTRSFNYLPNGEITFSRGENVMTSEKEHFTRTLTWKDSQWQEQGQFTWRLTEEGEGYKAVKRN